MAFDFGTTATGALGGAGTGALIGSVVPGIGTGIGAIAGGLIGGAAGAFGGGFGGGGGPSENDIMAAMQRDLSFANNLTQQFLTQGREAIDKEFNQALRIGREEIGEELGGRNLVGLDGTPASASTPGQKRFLDFMSNLQTGRSKALADLGRQASTMNINTMNARSQLTAGLRQDGGQNDFLSQLAGVGGQAAGYFQQEQQNKLLREALTPTTKANLPTLPAGSINTGGMRLPTGGA